MLSNRQNLGLLLGVLGVAVFAGSLPASRVAVSEVDPYFLTAMRATLAGLGGLTMLLIARRKFPPRAAWWPLVASRDHDRARLSAALRDGDGDGALLAWRRHSRDHAACDHGRRGGDPGRAAERRLLDRGGDRLGAGDGFRDLSQRRLFALRRRSAAAGRGRVRRHRLHLFRTTRRIDARMGGDLLGGGDLAAVVACWRCFSPGPRMSARSRRASGPRSSMPD